MENRRKPAPIFVPNQTATPFKLTNSGTFTEGDLTINRNGLRLAGVQYTVGTPTQAVAEPSAGAAACGSRPSSATSQGSSSPVEGQNCTSQGDVDTGASTSQLQSAPDGLQQSPSKDDLAIGECPVMSLSELQHLSQLGMGSSGVVNKVQHKSTGDVYALKMIQMDMQEQVRKNILQELRTLHKAKCENIVQCFGSFYDGGVIYSVLEFMDGGSLAHILKAQTRIAEKPLSRIAKQVLLGLTYLHKELHIVHRDVKPCNLLVNRQGKVKISDFGVSGKLASSVADCASWVGTVTYMSPERISGKCYSFDSDVWSLGLSMMECAQGRFPYPPTNEAGSHALSFWDLLDYIVERPPPEPVLGDFSEEFCSFVAAW